MGIRVLGDTVTDAVTGMRQKGLLFSVKYRKLKTVYEAVVRIAQKELIEIKNKIRWGITMKEQLMALKVQYDEVLGRFLGKEDFYLRMLKKFLDDKNFEGLEMAVQAKEWPEAFKYAHTVKGLCGNLGLDGILEYVAPLTEELRNEPYSEDRIAEYMSGAAEQYRKAVDVISAL